MKSGSLRELILTGKRDDLFTALYGHDAAADAKARSVRVIKSFSETFGNSPEALFSAPGRTEIGGNHTDHQHGLVLAAAVDLDMLAAAAANDSGLIRVCSEGYGMIEVDIPGTEPDGAEFGTTAALIRGVAAGMSLRGCSMEGKGADIYMTSSVPGGSGLSSSAAFEILIATVFNEMFFGGKFSPVDKAIIGQYAENVFFGKPCGLMDQTASSVGGVVKIDFADPGHPDIEKIGLDLGALGYALCIMECGADHADLTGEYAAITGELSMVSGYFGKKALRDVPEEDFMNEIGGIRKEAGDRAVLRALHVYAENKRVIEEARSLRDGDFESFLKTVRESGRSSAECLQNVIPSGAAAHQELMLAIAFAERVLAGSGAVRVHGGGFAGTAQAFVPLGLLGGFKSAYERVFGTGSCHVVTIRSAGGVRIA